MVGRVVTTMAWDTYAERMGEFWEGQIFKWHPLCFGRVSSATRYFSFFTPYKLALAYLF